jgi:Cd2+/Zn2+-exporting ATPase
VDVAVRRVAADSTIARIIHLVEHAQKQRAPVQTFVDRFARRYTPAVVLIALVVAFGGPLVTGGISGYAAAFGVWSYRALALLVVACPCALVISTPVSIVSALTTAARAGVLIKGGAHLERLGSVKSVAFDKTGTLTYGRITVTDVLGLDGASADSVLAIAAALEARSEHPIGRAIVHRARVAGLEVQPGASFRALPGWALKPPSNKCRPLSGAIGCSRIASSARPRCMRASPKWKAAVARPCSSDTRDRPSA